MYNLQQLEMLIYRNKIVCSMLKVDCRTVFLSDSVVKKIRFQKKYKNRYKNCEDIPNLKFTLKERIYIKMYAD